ncbi:polysaccharide pyruvyl transferase family protein [Ensifer soli]|uniref:polysaccharide pyruvyl transferase family protein n=1 Tax=Ciceribacter sp. sgz301302 TaxID=3342379 RepID=UPI0035B7DC7E
MTENRLAAFAREKGYVPLAWAGSTSTMDYLNFGDALSPVMVSLLSGLTVRRIPSKSKTLRMACVGTIGHGFADGEVWFWGTGCSPYSNPSAPAAERVPFTVPPGSDFRVTATRGPLSEELLTGRPSAGTGVYGDPVWLLPRFYAPKVEKTWKLGVILHLSELADRGYVARVRDGLLRYVIPEEFADSVHLITTVTPIGTTPLKDKVDEILACERIVSTSLHGMVMAECYGIPCLHFPTKQGGLMDHGLEVSDGLDLRVIDLYRGLGKSRIPVFAQPHGAATDWQAVMDAVDRAWTPVALDGDRLIEAFPLDRHPLSARAGATVWDDPVLQGLQLQHDVAELRRQDKLAR